MQELDKQTRELLDNMYQEAQHNIDRILFDKNNEGLPRNSIIHNADWNEFSPYFIPTLEVRDTPLTDERGELAYYINIRTALEYALIKGKIPYDRFGSVLIRAPERIKQLLSDREGNSVKDVFLG